jgi:hypothetical protein
VERSYGHKSRWMPYLDTLPANYDTLPIYGFSSQEIESFPVDYQSSFLILILFKTQVNVDEIAEQKIRFKQSLYRVRQVLGNSFTLEEREYLYIWCTGNQARNIIF